MSYYVTVKDHSRTGYLAGPFRRHGDALAIVDEVAKVACAGNREAIWFGFGTSRVRTGHSRVGLLNTHLGLAVSGDGFISREGSARG